ncbi:antirestriction protein ArdR [Pseudomonas sp. UMAB-40]|uniref:antirestriction protein ArdR n=1 Tax=Pseudomonas sp. UMAB-40 TaxID=1365407 RepID=UPI001C589481|nr:antirestriction protein ArdR [Pseudomonas sp. UMAB-40]
MSELIRALHTTATHWRKANQEHRGGVVLIWQGEVYGWKDCVRDASHERPGVYAVDEAGHVFIAEGGDYQNGAKAWVAVNPDI